MTSAQDTKPPPLTNAVCMHCGYDITGTIPDDDGRVTCPECGVILMPLSCEPLTMRGLHQEMAIKFILPFFMCSIAFVAIFQIPVGQNTTYPNFYELTLVSIYFAYMFCYPIALVLVVLMTCISLYQRIRIDTSLIPHWMISIWALLYTSFDIAVFILVLYIVG